jgi:hypothetical protein
VKEHAMELAYDNSYQQNLMTPASSNKNLNSLMARDLLEKS